MNLLGDADPDTPWRSAPDYEKVNLVSEHYQRLGMTRREAEEYLFNIAPTMPEVSSAFAKNGTLAFMEFIDGAPVGTVFITNDYSVDVYTIKTGELEDGSGYPYSVWSSKEIGIQDFEMPDLRDKTLDLLTRYTVKLQRASEIEGYSNRDAADQLRRGFTRVSSYAYRGPKSDAQVGAILTSINLFVFGTYDPKNPVPLNFLAYEFIRDLAVDVGKLVILIR